LSAFYGQYGLVVREPVSAGPAAWVAMIAEADASAPVVLASWL
jgi:hypothetical protein